VIHTAAPRVMFRVEHLARRGVFFVKAKYKKAREVE
jgi:hypothetical protein